MPTPIFTVWGLLSLFSGASVLIGWFGAAEWSDHRIVGTILLVAGGLIIVLSEILERIEHLLRLYAKAKLRELEQEGGS